jgi:MFS family permease
VNLNRTSLRAFCLVLSGNVFDHYDSNLYAMMVPFLSPLFFPKSDPVVSLIMAYSLLSVGILTRPLGAFVFGHLARSRGPGYCLQLSLCGMALATGGMALLPTHSQIGGWAPIGLAILRGLQGFFGAGETAIAGLYALSFCSPMRHGWYGGIYQSSTVLGIFLASGMAMSLSFLPTCSWLWRVPFFLGFFTACIGVYFRSDDLKRGERRRSRLPEIDRQLEETQDGGHASLHILYKNRSLFGSVVAVSALSYLTYSIPFIFMTTFVPLVNPIPVPEMMFMGNACLLLDMLLCPFIGKLADRFSLVGVMKTAAMSLALGLIPIFCWLPHATPWMLFSMRMWVVLWGLVFLAPLYGWLAALLPRKDRFLIQGVGYQVGSEVFGRSLPAVCMWLWYQTHAPFVLGLYVASFAVIAYLVLRRPLPLKRPRVLGHIPSICLPSTEEISDISNPQWLSPPPLEAPK